MTKRVFINQFDTFQSDLLEFRESKYMREKVQDCYISIFYCPANHVLYLYQLENKTAEQTLKSLLEFQKYIKPLEVDLQKLVTDQGKEYYSVFEDYLKQHDIHHRIVLHDDLQLAPINSMCRYIRQQLQQRIQKQYELSPDNEEGQKLITKQDLNKIIKEFIKFHNYEKVIPLYKEVPVNITRKQVEEINKIKRKLNENIDNQNELQPGDVVKVLLLKSKLEKQRENKWSRGLYQIIYKHGSFYQLVPYNFSFKEYAQTFKIPKEHPAGEPVYFRKSYQIKKSSVSHLKYYPYEMETTNFYTFEKIISSLNKNSEKIISQGDFYHHQKDYYYKIYQNQTKQDFIIKPFWLKPMDHTIITPIEDNYWNGSKLPKFYKPIFQFI
ncbi:Conserved_hypothetical protein [Hexamita inflata]|uniref:Integrase catalytic domain-containing protein n=1 Tax=Hexamita inflata TaxID=28002 RepID=A0AA86NIC2_9EUKA|nr:Conserved hypothetical protein [Hexamita inflata]CAI9944603.1 Conserved hypothetical protein [Hexamita inflata]